MSNIQNVFAEEMCEAFALQKQGQIQDLWKSGSNVQRDFTLSILKIIYEKEIISTRVGFEQTQQTLSGSATEKVLTFFQKISRVYFELTP